MYKAKYKAGILIVVVSEAYVSPTHVDRKPPTE